MAKTREEIDALIENWKKDPCWDIENTEGFEEHHDELLAWRTLYEGEQEREYDRKLKEKSALLGVNRRIAEDLFTFAQIRNETESEEFRGLQVSLTHAVLLLAAQVKRIADQLEENENNRMGEDDARKMQEAYRASKW